MRKYSQPKRRYIGVARGTAAVLLVALLSALPVSAQIADATRLFEEGNQLYIQGAYLEAVARFEEAQTYGLTSGALLLNVGNAYYRLDQRGQALRYYEKAYRLLGEEPHLMHNLQFVRAQVASPIAALPVPVWQQWWQAAVGARSPWLFFAAGAVFYLASCLLFAHRAWTQRRSPWHRRARTATLGLALVLLVMAYGGSLGTSSGTAAIVIEPTAELREDPNGPAILDVTEGVKVDVLGLHDGVAEVRLPNGVRGYVSREFLGEI